MSQLEATVHSIVLALARQRAPELESVTGEQSLTNDLGLDSLDLAQLVAQLEMELGVDPFSSDVTVAEVRTVADLCRVYERAAGAP